jgi:hypothetical protein
MGQEHPPSHEGTVGDALGPGHIVASLMRGFRHVRCGGPCWGGPVPGLGVGAGGQAAVAVSAPCGEGHKHHVDVDGLIFEPGKFATEEEDSSCGSAPVQASGGGWDHPPNVNVFGQVVPLQAAICAVRPRPAVSKVCLGTPIVGKLRRRGSLLQPGANVRPDEDSEGEIVMSTCEAAGPENKQALPCGGTASSARTCATIGNGPPGNP